MYEKKTAAISSELVRHTVVSSPLSDYVAMSTCMRPHVCSWSLVAIHLYTSMLNHSYILVCSCIHILVYSCKWLRHQPPIQRDVTQLLCIPIAYHSPIQASPLPHHIPFYCIANPSPHCVTNLHPYLPSLSSLVHKCTPH